MKEKMKKLISITFAIMLAFGCAFGMKMPVDAHESEAQRTNHIETSETSPVRATIDVDGSTIKVHTHVETNGCGQETIFVFSYSDDSFAKRYDSPRNGADSYFDIDASGYADGNYELVFTNDLWSLNFVVSDGIPCLVSGDGQASIDFMNGVAGLNPEDYKELYSRTKKPYNYDQINSTAKSIVANCKTDEEKVKAIYDWILNNIRQGFSSDEEVDYEYNGCEGDADWTFDKKRAVGDGVERLAVVMLTSVGVPAVNTKDNFASCIIYYNGKWHLFRFSEMNYAGYDMSPKYYGCTDDVSGIVDLQISEIDIRFSHAFSVGSSMNLWEVVESSPEEYYMKTFCQQPRIVTVNDSGEMTYINAGESVVTVELYRKTDNSFAGRTDIYGFAKCDSNSLVPEDSNNTLLYRVYNPYTHEHLYSTNTSEVNYLISSGCLNEWAMGDTENNTDPVYRAYNPYTYEHHYTQDIEEYNFLQDIGWNGEGIAFYSGGRKAVYRLFNPNSTGLGAHHYTIHSSECSALVESSGWIYEGIGWYLN